MFQRFEIHSRIVRRSGITFYGARDKLLGREVWLWRLFEFGDTPRPTEEQLNAAKAPLRALRHPGIVTLHDIEVDPDGLVALLEPAVGEPLDEWMVRGPVDLEDFQQIAESCLNALSASAAAGVPHGSLEPGLIFTSKTAAGGVSASLVGCGIARLVMRFHGDHHECSEALDVWTLGGILHALLTCAQIEEGREIRSPHEMRPEIPVAVSEWVMRLLVDDASLRPQTAADALSLFSHAVAPVPVDSSAAFHLPMQPAPWAAGHDPNLHPPVWHYPPVHVWHAPPGQWPQPHEPAPAAQQQQYWQQIPWYPWPGQIAAEPQHEQLAAAQPASPPPARLPVTQTSNAPKRGSPAAQKSTAAAVAKSASVPARQKSSPRRWIGPAISLAAAAVVVWFFRDVFATVFHHETWQGMLGDKITIQWPGGGASPATVVTKEGSAPSQAIPLAVASKGPAGLSTPAKPRAKTPPAPTGPIFIKKYSIPAKKGDPFFTAADGRFTVETAPASWSGGQKVGKLTAQKPFAVLTAPLADDARLALKKGTGIELQCDVHIDGDPVATSRGFRFGLFDAKKGGCFAVVPVGGPGELMIFGSKPGCRNPAADDEAHELKSTGNRATSGLIPGKVVRCTLTVSMMADASLQIHARAGDATAAATIDSRSGSNISNFSRGLVVLRNGENISDLLFDNVKVEAVKP